MKKVPIRQFRDQNVRGGLIEHNQTVRIKITAVSENTLGEQPAHRKTSERHAICFQKLLITT